MTRQTFRILRYTALLIITTAGSAQGQLPEEPCREGDKESLTDALSRLLEPGEPLPNADVIDKFENAFPESLAVLQKGLASRDRFVRNNAACVIDGLGPKADPLVDNLRIAYRREKETINRVYFAMAFAGIADRSEETLSLLRQAFEHEDNIKLKTYIAGALVAILDANKEPDAWQWLMNSLTDDLPDSANEDDVERHWDRRSGASFMLGRLGVRGRPALTAMKKLAESDNVPAYVKQQLNDDIPKIRFAKQGDL